MTEETDKLMVFRWRRGKEPDDVLPGPDQQEACQNRHVRGIHYNCCCCCWWWWRKVEKMANGPSIWRARGERTGEMANGVATATASSMAPPRSAPPLHSAGLGRRRRPRWRAGVRDERGAVAAELVIATPLLLLLVMGVIQFALWEHATGIAEAAAQQGLSVARLQGESAQAGTVETRSVLGQLGTGVLIGPQVTTTRTGAATTVVVSGHAESIVGIFSLPVRATAVGPTEPPLVATTAAAGGGP